MDPPPLHPDSERLRLELDILASELEIAPEAPPPGDEVPPTEPPAPPDPSLTLIIWKKP